MSYARKLREENGDSFVSVNRFFQSKIDQEVTFDETKSNPSKKSLSGAWPLFVQVKKNYPTVVQSDGLTSKKVTDAKNKTQTQSMDRFRTTRNEKVTVYYLTPDDGLNYINYLLQSDTKLSRAGEILTYTDLVSSALNITTLGLFGYISVFFDHELKLIKKAYDDLKSMYIAAWPATNI